MMICKGTSRHETCASHLEAIAFNNTDMNNEEHTSQFKQNNKLFIVTHIMPYAWYIRVLNFNTFETCVVISTFNVWIHVLY